MSRTLWTWVRVLGGAAILAALVWRLGAGPFLDGLRMVDARALALAVVLVALTTLCSAWRWSLVARGIGTVVPLRTAVAAYYRSQFLNTTLPGGILGDVHRAVSHGREVGDVGEGLRGVAWERTAGQVVQIALTLVVLLLLPSPVHAAAPVVALALVVAVVAAVLLSRRLPRHGPSRWARALRTAASDLRDGLLARRAWPGIVLASTLVVAGHAATFLVAARTAGSTVSPVRILPLALLVLAAMAVPTNVGGWGPREGAAAWVFGAAGLSASQGVSTAVVYGVMVFVACLPGAAVLLVGWLRRRTPAPARPRPPARRTPVAAASGGARG